MISALPVLCYGVTASALQSQSIHQITSSTSPAPAFFKLSRDPSSLTVCSPQIQAIRIQSLRGNQNLKAIEMSEGNRWGSGMKLDVMGMTIGCFISCPLHTNNLLPFISKILGYSIIAASTVGKLPQVLSISFTVLEEFAS
jgi:mannose-P-dolichol utilization defect 1